MTLRSSSLVLCGLLLLVACIRRPREPTERIAVAEVGADHGARAAAIGGGSGGAWQSAAAESIAGAAGSEDERNHSSVAGGVTDSPTVGVRAGVDWHPSDPTPWRSAIENYVPSVRPGNQTAINTAAMAFARYMNAVHNRIHPLFTGGFLFALDSLPAGHPLNDQRLSTELEIVLNQESGDVVRMGVTKFSGVTAFDIGALESVKRAAPFGMPPREIVSPDGNVYLHWEFHRNREACSTFNARPFLLKAQVKAAAD
jgi:hypothetical protein